MLLNENLLFGYFAIMECVNDECFYDISFNFGVIMPMMNTGCKA